MNNPFPHERSRTCVGEYCRCGAEATHKVGEEMALDQKQHRHNFTAYVCCKHFSEIFGSMARAWCETGDMLSDIDKSRTSTENTGG